MRAINRIRQPYPPTSKENRNVRCLSKADCGLFCGREWSRCGGDGRCFAENAVVRDEGRTTKGSAAIERWKAETTEKYEHTVEPLAVVRKSGKTIVTGRVAG